MSAAYEPKALDTVTITLKPLRIESSAEHGVLMVGGTWARHADITSIEKVPDPLPTTPGSVIRGNLTQRRYFRTESEWVCESGSRHPPADLGTSLAPFTMVFDAGKATP